MAEIAEEVALPVRIEDADSVQCVLAGEGVPASRSSSGVSGRSLLDSETSGAALSEEVETAARTNPEWVVSSPVSGLVNSSTQQTKLDSGIRPTVEIPEPLQGTQFSFGETLEDSGLDSPFAVVVLERSCGPFGSPPDDALIPAVTDWSDKENPGFLPTPERDLHGLRNVLRAPMKPARMSVLNRTVSSSSVRRRLNFDGL